jgi:hypothetical protein
MTKAVHTSPGTALENGFIGTKLLLGFLLHLNLYGFDAFV